MRLIVYFSITSVISKMQPDLVSFSYQIDDLKKLTSAQVARSSLRDSEESAI